MIRVLRFFLNQYSCLTNRSGECPKLIKPGCNPSTCPINKEFKKSISREVAKEIKWKPK